MKKQPILKAESVKPYFNGFEVIGAFNPSVIKYKDKTIMIIRVAERPIQNVGGYYLVPEFDKDNNLIINKLDMSSGHYDFTDCRMVKNTNRNYLTSVSYFLIAESYDGVNFKLTEKRIFPQGDDERYGIEDSRITEIDGEYYITYSAISDKGINTKLMVTKDFESFTRLGVIFCADNKDVVIFPKKINGNYYALHRPCTSEFAKPDMWIAQSQDLICWGKHKVFLTAKESGMARVGAGAVPILTEKGWLEIFHAADEKHVYKLYAMFLNSNKPEIIELLGHEPLIEVSEDFEKDGFFKNVVFTCGAIAEGDTIKIYYGTCDTNIAMAELKISEIYSSLGGE